MISRESVRLLLRHQAAAAGATAIDFVTMIFLVDAVKLPTFAATLCGAFVGAVVNFTLGRAWAFSSEGSARGNILPQVARYAFVSGMSAALNALGVFVLSPHGGAHSHAYVVARIIVSFAVSLFWNFPMQKSFVFRVRRESRV